MAHIRVLTPHDLPAAAALLTRVYPGHRWPSLRACEQYLGEVLFGHPWRDLQLPSWVAEEGAQICGLYAVMPRRMRLGKRTLTAAIGCQCMVDPRMRRGLAALQLLKACLAGAQDLTIVDGATDMARRLFAGLGAVAPVAYNMHWTRPLRPARFALSLLQRGAARRSALAAAAQPVADCVDHVATRLRPNRFLREACDLVESDLDCTVMTEHLADMSSARALRPDYDSTSLAWLLERLAGLTERGCLRRRAVHDRSGHLLGWYLHFVRAGAVSEVVQLAARDGALDDVLRCLLADAWRHQSTAVHGRFEPAQALALAQRNCWLRAEGPWTAVHSNDSEITAAVQRGDAFFSRLDGEWWLSFQRR